MTGLLNPYTAFLDACVLAPMPVADTLLRLAEEPSFYVPKWSDSVLEETRRTLKKFGYPDSKVDRRIRVMNEAFEDALVIGFEELIPAMTNDAKDRHVLAAAITCNANVIVTDNKRHFPAECVARYGMEVMSADEFLVQQLSRDKNGPA